MGMMLDKSAPAVPVSVLGDGQEFVEISRIVEEKTMAELRMMNELRS